MKKGVFLFAIFGLAFLFSACSSSESDDTNGYGSDTLAIETPDTINLPILDSLELDTIALEVPTLDELMNKQEDKIKQLFQNYKTAISKANSIEHENELKRIFSMRDSLIDLIQYDVLESHFDEVAENYEEQEKLEKDLDQLGIHIVYVEGMYGGLAESLLLPDEIGRVATDAYRYYLSFKQAYGNSLGSEYTYDNLEPEMDMVQIGEMIRSEFPETEYVELSKENYEAAVLALTDFHVTLKEDSTAEFWIIGGIENDFYPNGTSKENFENFVANYSDTKTSKLTEKILKNPSCVYANQADADTMYLLTVEWHSTWSQAREAAIQKAQSGFDATHCLKVKTEEGNKYALTYRFYPSLAQAEENLPWAKEEVTITKVLRSQKGLEKLEDL